MVFLLILFFMLECKRNHMFASIAGSRARLIFAVISLVTARGERCFSLAVLNVGPHKILTASLRVKVS